MSHASEKPDLSTPEVTDEDIRRLLTEAYDVPPLPSALRSRLDQAVMQEWGSDTPILRAPRARRFERIRRAARVFTPRAVAMRTLAACVVGVLVFAIVVIGSTPKYSWASMLEALSRQSIVQIGATRAESGQVGSDLVESDRGNVRWMSLAEGVVSERAGESSRLLDVRKGVIWERHASESHINSRPLAVREKSVDRDSLLAALLVGQTFLGAHDNELPSVKVLSEHCSEPNDQGEVNLQVTLAVRRSEPQDTASQEWELEFVLDQATHLPKSGKIVSGQSGSRDLNFTYSSNNPRELVARDFPSELPVIEQSTSDMAVAGDRLAQSTSTDGRTRNGASDPNNAASHQNDRPLTGAASLGWTSVTPTDLSRDELVQRVDDAMAKLWAENGVKPVARAGDEELLRRVYLDLAGRTPTVTEVRTYSADTSPDRFERLVDDLVASRDHATHLATVWRTSLLPEGVDLTQFGGIAPFDEWLAKQFRNNVPYDELVRRLVLAEGRLSKSGPLLFYSALKLDADQLAGRTARVFLGLRLDCAQCHDDPFEPWTQKDFWSYAAFFARISRPQGELETVSTVMRVRDIDRGEVMLPDSNEVVSPRFLDGSTLDETPEAAARRQQLAHWLTGPDNPFFARAAVNRVWAEMFGKGIVDPVDGFGQQHEPRIPEVLDLLAGRFIQSGFDIHDLFRTIALTRAYQLSSGSETAVPERQEWFAQMNVKILTAEQIYDCITVATLLGTNGSDGRPFALQRVGNVSRDEFLQQFRVPAGRVTEYQAGIPQALTLMNGALIGNATDLAGSGLLRSLDAPFFTDDQRIEVIYLATLSRKPSEHELEILRPYVAERPTGVPVREALSDILWAVLNSAEFTMNH